MTQQEWERMRAAEAAELDSRDREWKREKAAREAARRAALSPAERAAEDDRAAAWKSRQEEDYSQDRNWRCYN